MDIQGIGTTTLVVTGCTDISMDVDYAPSEDPIEAMSLLAAAIVTDSEITVKRVPIEFLEIELAVLEEMGFRYKLSEEYVAANGHTRLADITTLHSILRPPIDKIHPMPFPGLNIDNLPFFAIVAACAQGQTMLHDWVYENRAIYLTELNKLGGKVTLMDPHRVMIEGPTRWSGDRGGLPAGTAPGRGDPAGDAGLEGNLGAALDVRHPPGLRGPRRPAQRARRPDRDASTTSEPASALEQAVDERPGPSWGEGPIISAVIRGSWAVSAERFAVPVVLGLDQAAEVGPVEEHPLTGVALPDRAPGRGTAPPWCRRTWGRSSRPCSDGTAVPSPV